MCVSPRSDAAVAFTLAVQASVLNAMIFHTLWPKENVVVTATTFDVGEY